MADDTEDAGPVETALMRRRKMLEAASKRNIAQFQQSNMGATRQLPPEMIRAQQVLARLNGGQSQGQASVASEQPNPLDSVAVRGSQLVDEPMNPLGRKAMGTSEVSGLPLEAAARLQGLLADPRYVAARRAQSDAARARASQPGFRRPTRQDANNARYQARIEAMKQMQDLALRPQLALIAAQQGSDPKSILEHNAYRAAIAQKLVEAGMPLDEAMQHPWVAGGQQRPGMQQQNGAPPGAPVPSSNPNGRTTISNNPVSGKPEVRKRRADDYSNMLPWQLPVSAYSGMGAF